MAQNLFSPIDWNQSDAQAELEKRRQMNAQIDYMNQTLKANQGNKLIQNALLEQYMGMAFPQQQDPTTQLDIAANLMNSQDPTLTAAAKKMYEQNALTKDYLSQTNPQSEVEQTTQAKMLDAFLKQFDTSAMQDTDASKIRNLKILAQAQVNPTLASQYYNTTAPDIWSPSVTPEQLNQVIPGYSGMNVFQKLGAAFDPNNVTNYKLRQAGFNF